MTPAFDALQKQLKKLPGVGYRSAERMAIHLLQEKPESCQALIDALKLAKDKVASCPRCGNLSEDGKCEICSDSRRIESGQVCVVEHHAAHSPRAMNDAARTRARLQSSET